MNPPYRTKSSHSPFSTIKLHCYDGRPRGTGKGGNDAVSSSRYPICVLKQCNVLVFSIVIL